MGDRIAFRRDEERNLEVHSRLQQYRRADMNLQSEGRCKNTARGILAILLFFLIAVLIYVIVSFAKEVNNQNAANTTVNTLAPPISTQAATAKPSAPVKPQTPAPTTAAPPLLALSCGGNAIAYAGINYVSDAAYAASGTSFYSNVTNNLLFDSDRQWNASALAYTLQIPTALPINVLVKMSFVELQITGALQRVFNILVNGVAMTFGGIDVFSEAGGIGIMISHQVLLANVSTPLISINVQPSVGSAFITAIELYQQ